MKKAKHEFEMKHIAEGHTLQEYRRYFGFDYDNGRFVSYLPSEVKYMKPHRYYWKIKDEVGRVRYYELPPYIRVKTKHVKSLTNLHRAMMWIGIVIATLGLGVCTYTAVANILYPPKVYPDIPLSDLKSCAERYLQWKDQHKEEANPDITQDSKFKTGDIAEMSLANAAFKAKESSNSNEYEVERNNYITVGYGTTYTTMVDVNIANMFMYKDGNALEESISVGTVLQDLTNSATRDYFYSNDFQQKDINGTVKSIKGGEQNIIFEGKTVKDVECKWHEEPVTEFESVDAYKEKAGKNPYEPFLYVISNETVLETSHAEKTDNGYFISLDLDPEKSVGIYSKRMEYLSGKHTLSFKSVHMDITTDTNLRITSSSVDEYYTVNGGLPKFPIPIDTHGKLTTNYYYDDKIKDLNIPEYSASFKYEDFPDTRR